MKVFISSPYTIGDPVENVHRQIDAAEQLLNAGHFPYVPLLDHHWHEIYPHDWKDWMNLSLHYLDVCDCVLRLDGESKGGDIEVRYAYSTNKPVYYDINKLI